ncbi:hypothetical protein FOZ63_030843, partial [Perkinsus olseni]
AWTLIEMSGEPLRRSEIWMLCVGPERFVNHERSEADLCQVRVVVIAGKRKSGKVRSAHLRERTG